MSNIQYHNDDIFVVKLKLTEKTGKIINQFITLSKSVNLLFFVVVIFGYQY